MKYDINSLIQENRSYHHEHTVTQADVDKVNAFVELIEKTRCSAIPKAGDRIRYTTQHGDYYHTAHIDYNKDRECNICEQPYVPFIWENDDKTGITCSTSGGAWGNILADELLYEGSEKKCFCFFGHCGARGNGAVRFEAEVSVWRWAHPEPLYGDFTTEKWRKFHVSKIADDKRHHHNDYLYTAIESLASKGNMQTAFRTEPEYQAWLDRSKATVFPGGWANTFVVWGLPEDE